MESERRYASFLVRLWQEPGNDDYGTAWRGSVEHVQTGEKRFFIDMESLMVYLRTVAESEDAAVKTESGNTVPLRRLIG